MKFSVHEIEILNWLNVETECFNLFQEQNSGQNTNMMCILFRLLADDSFTLSYLNSTAFIPMAFGLFNHLNGLVEMSKGILLSLDQE